jgi:RimJ/RimL family protein N-acetyltransferase
MDQIDYINRSIRVGGDIHKDYRGKGYGTKMFELIVSYCFNYLNSRRLWLMVLETNEKAIQLYKKIGFKEEGRQIEAVFKNGKYIDYLMMSKLKG